jgi:hypothetical protein
VPKIAQPKNHVESQPDQDDDDWEPIAADDPRTLVPEGEYDVICARAERRFYAVYRRFVIVLTFRIHSDPYAGVFIERFFNVPADGKIPRGSHYFREWILANGVKPHRRERMAKRKFVGKLFRAQVVTVTTSRDGQDLGPAASYSKVARLLELLVTNETAPPCSTENCHTFRARPSINTV